MSKKMLIDASHPEETRVVIVEGSRIEELDFESQNKRQLRGNVYLARVTRVEPSLQAAFVEYGGNRHGFLAFSEIHPDYYQIPYEDRMALLEDEEAENKAEDDDNEDHSVLDDSDDAEAAGNGVETVAEGEADDEDVVEELEKTASSRMRRMSRRRYKIQEVIKRGQILLIQVVKEERGNKGAAMTTYLSLAGRYCVLMPNTPRGGGISRKIPNGTDRKRIKSVVSEFDVPQGMGVIVRTAGAKRTKLEIKRDYDYLCRLWETTREMTLKSIAPALIHEEGNLVKRSIRDLYNKDIEEVLVQGDEAYKTAKAFIKLLMPSHAKNVKAYKDPIPLFLRYQVESQIEDSLDSVVQLKSGGYLVIHPTEALVSVDVNSGRSTRERNVERTALKTNLEAATEVARQMRLRDLAGLVVIDFIDMDENRNNRAVEKCMKDALARDRARVQSSRISQFGLMEISRQRRRRSLLEGSTAHCEHCEGVGRKRTIESSALRAIRAVEETGVRGKAKRIRLKVAPDVALYLFNEKRELLNAVESQFDLFTELLGDDTLIRPAFEVEVLEAADAHEDPLVEIEKELKKQTQKSQAAKADSRSQKSRQKNDDDEDESQDVDAKDEADSGDDEDQPKRRRRRGRRGGRGRKPEAEDSKSETEGPSGSDDALKVITPETSDAETPDTETKVEAGDKPKRRRRRAPKAKDASPGEAVVSTEGRTDASADADAEAAPKPKPKRSRKKAAPKKAETTTEADIAKDGMTTETPPEPKPMRSTTRRKAPTKKPAAKPEDAEPVVKDVANDEAKPKRKRAPRKKAAAEKASPEPKAETDAKPAETVESAQKTAQPVRSTTRRKAPSRKPKAEDVADVQKTPAPKPKETPAPEVKPEAKDVSGAADEGPKAKSTKKRGWWRRK